MEFVAMNRQVSIHLAPGLYEFESSSASGKTLLVKMVKSLGEREKIAVTYHDILMGIDLEHIIEHRPELLILDRFDLYDENASILEKARGMGSIVLVDYKTGRKFCDFDDTCWIELTDHSLEVSV